MCIWAWTLPAALVVSLYLSPAAGHQVRVLEGVAAAQEVLRDRVPEVTARPPRDNLATRNETRDPRIIIPRL